VLPERVLAFPLALRALEMRDAPRVQVLAGEREVAETTAQIPHPYPDGAAQDWIASQHRSRAEHSYAITLSEDGLLIGAIGLRPTAGEHGHLGYWIGRPYWGRGYATLATQALLAVGFHCLDVEELTAWHLERNAASGRVLEKCGLRLIRSEARDHRGRKEACCLRGITREAWEALRR
jgi:RimJ/RimL family protein N-acetyltransferase